MADDDPKQLEAARSWLPGRDILLEVDASKVVARVRDERPCLVILDLWQADRTLDGNTLAVTLKAERPELPIAVISAGLKPRVAALLARRGTADLILPKQGRRTFDKILAFVEHGIEPDPWSDGESSIIEVKRDYARGLLARVGGNKAEAARRAGVTWATFHRWIDEDADGAKGNATRPRTLIIRHSVVDEVSGPRGAATSPASYVPGEENGGLERPDTLVLLRGVRRL